MSRKELFKQLNQLCNNLNAIYEINCGGCCYVAACLAEQLELANIPFKVIHYNKCHCHYAIKVSDRYINRDDYRKTEITNILEISSKELFGIYYSQDWNHTYKTYNNSEVRRNIKEIFNNYENSRT
jgi:hypothetical protein